ncbi:thymidylate kinase [Candidatus Pacearchaeota archaeon]|nr:thymidylate kinase [Candidatus Pacearchaeota archaeon]
MERGKIIVIEGTDCSGKETQANILYEKLKEAGVPIAKMDFPDYKTPTGKIVGGPYLGKPAISEGWFPEGAGNVDPKVASLFYAADRRYALPKIQKILDSGTNLILDRYTSSSMGHQGGKIKDKEKREELYQFLETLEYGLMELPVPDITVFLHMPCAVAMTLRKARAESADQHENDLNHLRDAEAAYISLAIKYKWKRVRCAPDKTLHTLKTPEKISEEVWESVVDLFR